VTRNRTQPLDVVELGDGPALLLLPGFAMQPETYLPTARLLEDRARVVIPRIFDLPGSWRFPHALDCLEATLDSCGIDEFSLLGHSFSGGLVLGLAVRRPVQTRECIFSDTLADRDRFSLADEALRHPLGILALVTPRAASAFVATLVTHPLQLTAAGLWAFLSDRHRDIAHVVADGIPSHVLWASHDTLLSQSDGREFASELGATFTVAQGMRVEHDWIFEQPRLFVEHLEALPLRLFGCSP
jgi:pimeloyl-ACP methyl ester carboxylesterase